MVIGDVITINVEIEEIRQTKGGIVYKVKPVDANTLCNTLNITESDIV